MGSMRTSAQGICRHSCFPVVHSQLWWHPWKEAPFLFLNSACSICKVGEEAQRLDLESIESLNTFWEKWLFPWN